MTWTHDEVRSCLEQEMDFLNEAKNAERASKNFNNNPHYYIPKVNWDLTSRRGNLSRFSLLIPEQCLPLNLSGELKLPMWKAFIVSIYPSLNLSNI